MSADVETYAAIVRDLNYPMVIVPAANGTERAGCLVGYSSPASIDPPRFCVFISKLNRTFRVAGDAEVLVVHAVPRNAAELAQLFGGETGDDVNKFERCKWSEGPGGAPILNRCAGWFAGRITERWDAGDHGGFLLEPIEAGRRDATVPFTTRQGERIEPGHEA